VTDPGPRTEALLAAARAGAAWPATPDLRADVIARIAAGGVEPAPLGHSGTARRARSWRVARSLVLALLAVVAITGVAGALGFQLPGLEIRFVEQLPPAGSGLSLGTAVPLAEARAVEVPRVLLPAALPQPSTAYILGTGGDRVVTLAWRAAAGEPALAGSDLSLTLMAVPGKVEAPVLQKILGPGTAIEPVTVHGDRAWWISGTPHDMLIARPDGSIRVLTAVLAGNTLVFARDGTLYRIESALGRDATIAVADSMR